MDPNNVLIRCPAGHELQAARVDLGKPLSCPICNQTFTPGGVAPRQAAQAAVAPGTRVPVQFGYADGRLGMPATRPGYVGWLVGLWVAAEFGGVVVNLISLTQGQNPNPAAMPDPAFMAGGCLLACLVIPAVVLQLMWVYRIHADALRARGYREVSPGMALGLSFIPFFNYIWTGWTMKKLALVAAGGDGAGDPRTNETMRAATLCFAFGIAKALASCAGAIAGGAVSFEAAMQAGAGGPGGPAGPIDPFADVGPGFYVFTVLTNLVSLAAVLVYGWAVRKLHGSLYDFLGAPSR